MLELKLGYGQSSPVSVFDSYVGQYLGTNLTLDLGSTHGGGGGAARVKTLNVAWEPHKSTCFTNPTTNLATQHLAEP